MGTLFNQERIDHISIQRSRAKMEMRKLAVQLSSKLSSYEAYSLMIRAIEDLARVDADTIHERAAKVTATCQRKTIKTLAPVDPGNGGA